MNPARQALIKQISGFLLDVKSRNPRAGSVEWYLSNNLNRYLNDVKVASKSSDINNAARLFNHFSLDSLDYNSEYFKKSTAIVQAGLKAAQGLK